MLLTSFSRHRPNPVSRLDFTAGAFREGLRDYAMARGNGKLPKSFEHWSDAAIAQAVRNIAQDVHTAAPNSAADRFFEATFALANYLGPVAQVGAWQLSLGRVHVSLVVGPPNPSRPSQQDTSANPQEDSIELELTPELGDSPLSSNPDVAATQALRAFNDPSVKHEARVPKVVLDEIDDASLASAVRLLQPHCDAVNLVKSASLLAVGLVMAMESAMAEFSAAESQAEFERIHLPGGAVLSAHVEVHRTVAA